MHFKALHLPLLFFITSILFFPALKTGYFYDDFYHFAENEKLLRAQSLDDVIHNGRQETRPVYNVSLWVQNRIFGTDSTWAHAVNVAIHMAVGLLLYQLVLRLPDASPSLAFLAAAIFLIHPLCVESVVYFNSRSGLLSVLFSVAALLLFHLRRTWGVWASALCLILAMASKEDAVGTVLALGLFWYWHFRKGRPPTKLLNLGLVAVTLLTPAFLYLFFRSPHIETIGTSVADPFRYLWRQGIEIPLHISLFVWPYPLTLDRDLPVWLFSGLLPLVGWALLLSLAALLWRYRASIWALGFAWALLALVPTHSVVPLLDLEATRILYPALPGLSLACAALLFEIHKKIPKLGIAMMGIFAAFWMFRTSQQIQLWLDPVLLWTKDVEAAPTRWRAWANLAIEQAERGKWADATTAIVQAHTLAPEHPAVLYNSAVIWATRPDELRNEELAIEQLRGVLKAQPGHLRAQRLLKKLSKNSASDTIPNHP